MESAGNSGEADRLSALPTELLEDILCLGPTREAVKTCVVSRMWKDLWKSSPDLDLDDGFLHVSSDKAVFLGPSSSGGGDGVDQQPQFPDFVDEILIRRSGSDIRKLRLSLNTDEYKWGRRCANRCLSYATNHFVQQIDLSLWTQAEQYRLPCELFACKSLVDVSLNVKRGSLKLPETYINLPKLQSLKLVGITVLDNSIQQLLELCPNLKIFNMTECNLPVADAFDVSKCSCLESLSLERNHLHGIKNINITAPVLNSLIIRSCACSCDNCSVMISAPNLLCLEYNDHLVEKLCIENLQNLLDAAVGWNFDWDSIDQGILSEALEFLRGLENVRALRLYASTMEIPSWVANLRMHLPITYTNLKFLELVIVEVGIYEFKAIVCLLESCPSVETLVIEIKGGTDGGIWKSDYFPYDCKLYNLKEVEIKQSEESNIEDSPMKHLTMIAIELERIIDPQKQKKIGWKLLTHPRASLKMSIPTS